MFSKHSKLVAPQLSVVSVKPGTGVGKLISNTTGVGMPTLALVTLTAAPGEILLVSNEVGWGVVPMHPVSRLFADEQGRLNQRVAAVCERVTLVAAGQPLRLKA